MKNKIFKHIIMFYIIFLSYFVFSGYISPEEEYLKQQNNLNQKYIQTIKNYNNQNYEECLKNIEINNIIDSFYYCIEKDKINDLFFNYKNILIDQANNHLNNGDYISASNLLNSRQKYYESDNTIINLIEYNHKLLNASNLVEYTGEIEHLTFNTLMAFPEKALDSRNNLSNIYDETKVTKNEFENILNELYKNNYILINIDELYQINNGKISQKKLMLPKNKKPIILSFDNASYKSSYQNLGEIDKIIIDRNNNIATYTTKKSIQDRVQYDNEFIVILENFINLHPDFSYNNARGIIFLTGENGILGYNTNHNNASNKNETKRVSEVIKKLKSLGWKFGCNNYTYKDESQKADIEFAKELSLWNKEVKTIIGDTNLYAYPYGLHSDSDTTKQELLVSNNFEIFFINSDEPSIEFLNDICVMSRREINGETLRKNNKEFSHLFNCEKVYDHTNRTKTFYSLTQ